MDLSIVIPTLNRTKQLSKILNYYFTINLKAKIYILDSSDEIYLNKNIYEIQKCSNLNIVHKKIFGSSSQVMGKVLPEINTKYSVFSGDDDFFIEKGLEKSINFLDENNDFSASHGKMLNLIYSDEKLNSILNISNYNSMGFDNCFKKPLERLIFSLKNYQTSTFAVHRTEIFKKIYSYANTKKIVKNALVNENIFYNELLFNFLSCCYGKNKFLDNLYMVRTSIYSPNKKNFSSQKKIHDFFIKDEQGIQVIKNISNILSNEISSIDGSDYELNKKIVDKELIRYIKKTYIQYSKFFKIYISKNIKKILRFLGIFNFVKKLILKKKIDYQDNEKYSDELKIMHQFFID